MTALRPLILFFVGFGALWGVPNFARAEDGKCVLRALAAMVRADRAEFARFEGANPIGGSWSLVRSIDLGEVIERGTAKGPRQVIHRISGEEWASTYRHEPPAPQGDPRMFFFLARSVDVARFFGFEILGPDQMVVPLSERLNWAFRRLSELGVMISMKFEKVQGRSPVWTYVERFANEGIVPISEGDPILLHDLNFHASMIFLPDKLVRHSRSQAKTVTDFVSFVHERNPDLAKSPEVSALFEQWFAGIAHRLDDGSGNFSQTFPVGEYAKAYEFAFQEFAGDGLSPRDMLNSALGAENVNPEIRELAALFIASQKSDPSFVSGLKMTEGEFTAAVHARRRSVEAAVRLHAMGGH